MRVVINSGDWVAASWRERWGWRVLAWKHGAKIVKSSISESGKVYVLNVTQMYSEPIKLTNDVPYNEFFKKSPMVLLGELGMRDKDFKGSITDLSEL